MYLKHFYNWESYPFTDSTSESSKGSRCTYFYCNPRWWLQDTDGSPGCPSGEECGWDSLLSDICPAGEGSGTGTGHQEGHGPPYCRVRKWDGDGESQSWFHVQLWYYTLESTTYHKYWLYTHCWHMYASLNTLEVLGETTKTKISDRQGHTLDPLSVIFAWHV